jgi:hypothetical protein
VPHAGEEELDGPCLGRLVALALVARWPLIVLERPVHLACVGIASGRILCHRAHDDLVETFVDLGIDRRGRLERMVGDLV